MATTPVEERPLLARRPRQGGEIREKNHTHSVTRPSSRRHVTESRPSRSQKNTRNDTVTTNQPRTTSRRNSNQLSRGIVDFETRDSHDEYDNVTDDDDDYDDDDDDSRELEDVDDDYDDGEDCDDDRTDSVMSGHTHDDFSTIYNSREERYDDEDYGDDEDISYSHGAAHRSFDDDEEEEDEEELPNTNIDTENKLKDIGLVVRASDLSNYSVDTSKSLDSTEEEEFLLFVKEHERVEKEVAKAATNSSVVSGGIMWLLGLGDKVDEDDIVVTLPSLPGDDDEDNEDEEEVTNHRPHDYSYLEEDEQGGNDSIAGGESLNIVDATEHSALPVLDGNETMEQTKYRSGCFVNLMSADTDIDGSYGGLRDGEVLLAENSTLSSNYSDDSSENGSLSYKKSPTDADSGTVSYSEDETETQVGSNFDEETYDGTATATAAHTTYTEADTVTHTEADTATYCTEGDTVTYCTDRETVNYNEGDTVAEDTVTERDSRQAEEGESGSPVDDADRCRDQKLLSFFLCCGQTDSPSSNDDLPTVRDDHHEAAAPVVIPVEKARSDRGHYQDETAKTNFQDQASKRTDQIPTTILNTNGRNYRHKQSSTQRNNYQNEASITSSPKDSVQSSPPNEFDEDEPSCDSTINTDNREFVQFPPRTIEGKIKIMIVPPSLPHANEKQEPRLACAAETRATIGLGRMSIKGDDESTLEVLGKSDDSGAVETKRESAASVDVRNDDIDSGRSGDETESATSMVSVAAHRLIRAHATGVSQMMELTLAGTESAEQKVKDKLTTDLNKVFDEQETHVHYTQDGVNFMFCVRQMQSDVVSSSTSSQQHNSEPDAVYPESQYDSVVDTQYTEDSINEFAPHSCDAESTSDDKNPKKKKAELLEDYDISEIVHGRRTFKPKHRIGTSTLDAVEHSELIPEENVPTYNADSTAKPARRLNAVMGSRRARRLIALKAHRDFLYGHTAATETVKSDDSHVFHGTRESLDEDEQAYDAMTGTIDCEPKDVHLDGTDPPNDSVDTGSSHQAVVDMRSSNSVVEEGQNISSEPLVDDGLVDLILNALGGTLFSGEATTVSNNVAHQATTVSEWTNKDVDLHGMWQAAYNFLTMENQDTTGTIDIPSEGVGLKCTHFDPNPNRRTKKSIQWFPPQSDDSSGSQPGVISPVAMPPIGVESVTNDGHESRQLSEENTQSSMNDTSNSDAAVLNHSSRKNTDTDDRTNVDGIPLELNPKKIWRAFDSFSVVSGTIADDRTSGSESALKVHDDFVSTKSSSVQHGIDAHGGPRDGSSVDWSEGKVNAPQQSKMGQNQNSPDQQQLRMKLDFRKHYAEKRRTRRLQKSTAGTVEVPEMWPHIDASIDVPPVTSPEEQQKVGLGGTGTTEESNIECCKETDVPAPKAEFSSASAYPDLPAWQEPKAMQRPSSSSSCEPQSNKVSPPSSALDDMHLQRVSDVRTRMCQRRIARIYKQDEPPSSGAANNSVNSATVSNPVFATPARKADGASTRSRRSRANANKEDSSVSADDEFYDALTFEEVDICVDGNDLPEELGRRIRTAQHQQQNEEDKLQEVSYQRVQELKQRLTKPAESTAKPGVVAVNRQYETRDEVDESAEVSVDSGAYSSVDHAGSDLSSVISLD